MCRTTLFLFLLLLLQQRISGTTNSVDILISNRIVLIKNLKSCFTSIENPFKRCFFSEGDTLIKLLQSEKINNEDKDKIAKIYFSNSDKIIRANSSGLWVTDSINFNFLIKSLQSDSDYIAINAYNILLEQSSINHLRKYRSNLKESLLRSPLLSKKRRIQLLVLATDSVSMTINSSDSSTFEKEIEEYIHDTVFENRMVATLDTNPDFRMKLKAVKELLLRGNRRCLQKLILHFNEPSFDWVKASKTAPPCTTQTLRIPIIVGISRYFPEESLLNDSLYLLNRKRTKYANPEYVSRYFNKFLTWAKREFGIEPKEPALPPVLHQDCLAD